MERGRDRRYNDDRSLGGETYRPTERHPYSPPRVNNYRANRSPPRRGRTPQQYNDAYAPLENRGVERGPERGPDRPRSRSNRRRSRSPAFRGRDIGGNYRGRQRSPARGYSPRRDAPVRSPPRVRRFSRSPVNGVRPRSPFPAKRGREPSPIDNRRPRSPPYAKRERFASPTRERIERRGYSPPRDNGPRFPRENNYRPGPRERTRSPIRRSEHVSRIGSPISSRRSSPQIHPDRMALADSGTHSPAIRNPRQSLAQPSPGYRDRSPPRRAYTPIPVSPPREALPYRQRSPQPQRRRDSPPIRERNDFRNGSTPNTWSNAQMGGHQGSGYQNGDSRGPPNGPGSIHYNGSYNRDSPSVPPSAPISMSAHNRPSSAALLSAPTRPRGGSSFSRESTRDGPYGGPPPRRGHPSQSPYHGPPPRHQNYDSRFDGPPQGPRGPHQHSNGPPPFEPRPPFRTNNSSSTTYPRTQRFSQHLAGVPAIVPGGKLAASGMDPAAEKRLAQLEEDKKKLLEAIEEKQKAKRQGLREWDKTERESKREGLKSELAEGHLDRMTGEGGSVSGAAF